MTKRVAIIRDGVVVNVGLFEDDFVPDGVTQIDISAEENVNKGWRWNGATFTQGQREDPPQAGNEDGIIFPILRILASASSPATKSQVLALLPKSHRGGG